MVIRLTWKRNCVSYPRPEETGFFGSADKANAVRDKLSHLLQLMERLQVVEMLILLCRDMHIINVKGYSDLAVLTDSIGRQVQGWVGSQGGQSVK